MRCYQMLPQLLMFSSLHHSSLFNDSDGELKDHNRALEATPAFCRHLSPTMLTQGVQTQTALLTPHPSTDSHTHTHTFTHPLLGPMSRFY